MFEDFYYKILDDPEFKEDSVREEIISAILKRLGYSATGNNKIIRSKILTHPFIHLGTQKRKISIIPDYLMKVDDDNFFILDAKSPKEEITSGKNVEQAFSYAIHKDIRVQKYALCNGKELAIFNINKYEPVAVFQIENLDDRWNEIEKLISPIAFKKPHLLSYYPDYGISMLKMGMNRKMRLHFYGAWINTISKIDEYNFSIVSVLTIGNEIYTASFDFSKKLYYDLLTKIPKDLSDIIKESLSRMPYFVHYDKASVQIGIIATFSKVIHSNEDEDYLPLTVTEFFNV